MSIEEVEELLDTPRSAMRGEASRRNLGLDLVRATEAAALRAGRWMGMGRRDEPDRAATEAMHEALELLDIDGLIVVGEEGKLNWSSPLKSGAQVCSGNGPMMDVVVDAIDGRGLLATGRSGAISVAAVAPRGSMWCPQPAVYMDKIVVSREAAEYLVPEVMDAPAAWTLALIARVKKKHVQDLVVFVLDRARHRELIDEIRQAGARVMLRADGDIAGAIMAASPNGRVDVLMGVGGVPEGLIAACAVRALGGAMLGRLAPQKEGELEAIRDAGLSTDRIVTCDELVSSDEIYFAATGITDGPLLDGVTYRGRHAETHSLILRGKTHSRRFVHAEHVVAL